MSKSENFCHTCGSVERPKITFKIRVICTLSIVAISMASISLQIVINPRNASVSSEEIQNTLSEDAVGMPQPEFVDELLTEWRGKGWRVDEIAGRIQHLFKVNGKTVLVRYSAHPKHHQFIITRNTVDFLISERGYIVAILGTSEKIFILPMERLSDIFRTSSPLSGDKEHRKFSFYIRQNNAASWYFAMQGQEVDISEQYQAFSALEPYH